MKAFDAGRASWKRHATVRSRKQARRVRHLKSWVNAFMGEVQEAWSPVRRDDFGVGSGRPVLLLHGFGAPRRILHVLERRLRRNLGISVMSFHLQGLGGAVGGPSIPVEAAQLAEKLEKLCARHGVTELDVIGHSKGGLVARYMVSNFPVGKRVRNLITLGSPFRGAPLAVLGAPTLGFFSQSVWQLLPFSSFLRHMRQTPVPPGTSLVSISGSVDLVAPFMLCRLEPDEADPGLVSNHVVTGVTHNGLLVSRRVFQLIANVLRPARASRPAA